MSDCPTVRHRPLRPPASQGPQKILTGTVLAATDQTLHLTCSRFPRPRRLQKVLEVKQPEVHNPIFYIDYPTSSVSSTTTSSTSTCRQTWRADILDRHLVDYPALPSYHGRWHCFDHWVNPSPNCSVLVDRGLIPLPCWTLNPVTASCGVPAILSTEADLSRFRGTGYIGSFTVLALLEHGYRVIIVDSLRNSSKVALDRIELICGKRPDFYDADITKEDELDKVFAAHPNIDSVIHFAALKVRWMIDFGPRQRY